VTKQSGSIRRPPTYLVSVADVRAWLRERGAETIEHPGGTLYAHLGRVHDRLAALGLDPDVALAGLTHAAYGTDGFDVALLPLAERATLRTLIGESAESLVYRYGACDRGRTWSTLASARTVWDRFTGTSERQTPDELRPFVDLTIANELDLVEQDPVVVERYGKYLGALFRSWAGFASPAVLDEARRLLDLRTRA
jgi:uncharacterized protein DUF6817